MKIDIDRLDLKDVPVDPSSIFTFPNGILGYEGYRSYKVFHQEGADKPSVFRLQCLDDPDVAFSIVPSEMLDIQYEIELSDEDCKLLDLDDASQAAVVVIVYHNDVQAGGGGPKIAANTRSPLVLNLAKRRGMQKVLQEFYPALLYRGR